MQPLHRDGPGLAPEVDIGSALRACDRWLQTTVRSERGWHDRHRGDRLADVEWMSERTRLIRPTKAQKQSFDVHRHPRP
jgi:hypothetical protein